MSREAAEAFFDRAESDAAFRQELEELLGDNQAVYRHVVDSGFDVEPDEVMEAFTDRYGVELTPEQLDAVAAGDDTELIVGATIGGVAGVGLAAAVLAACAA